MRDVPNFLRELADLIERHADIVPPPVSEPHSEVKPIPGLVVVPLPVGVHEFQHRVPQQPLWNGEVFKSKTDNVYDDGHKTVCSSTATETRQ